MQKFSSCGLASEFWIFDLRILGILGILRVFSAAVFWTRIDTSVDAFAADVHDGCGNAAGAYNPLIAMINGGEIDIVKLPPTKNLNHLRRMTICRHLRCEYITDRTLEYRKNFASPTSEPAASRRNCVRSSRLYA